MSAVVRRVDTDTVACVVCLRELPNSQAGIVEFDDDLMYFCSLDCYRQWRESQNGMTY
ncbi:MAG: DUF3330 domain-containing protein [Gammaproteobacteria bacterium]